MHDPTLPLIRASCAACVSTSTSVHVDAAAARALALALPALLASDPSLASDGVDFPLALATEDDVVSLTVLHALLSFGSGFRQELHAATGGGAADTVLRGVLRF